MFKIDRNRSNALINKFKYITPCATSVFIPITANAEEGNNIAATIDPNFIFGLYGTAIVIAGFIAFIYSRSLNEHLKRNDYDYEKKTEEKKNKILKKKLK